MSGYQGELNDHCLTGAFDGKMIQRDAIYWEHEGNRAIRQDNWKLGTAGKCFAVALGSKEEERKKRQK